MATLNPFLNQPTVLMIWKDRFLDTQAWIRQATVCKSVHNLYKVALRAAPLMDHVLNITEERKQKILEIIEANPELILVRTKGDVKYPSSKQKKMVVRIRISDLSPLEAAALSGDFHLVNIFRDALPDHLKNQAGLQLDAILSRSDFLFAFKAFLDACQNFLKEFDTLRKTKAKDWKTVDELWEQMGEAQKKLSTFGLQVFCNPVPHDPIPDFILEPVRGCRFEPRYEPYENKVVDSDLDLFGLGTGSALHKLKNFHPHRLTPRVEGALPDRAFFGWAHIAVHRYDDVGADLEAISRLSKVIYDQLSNTRTLLLQYPTAADKDKKRARKR